VTYAERASYAETPRERLAWRLGLSQRSRRWFDYAACKRAERRRRGRWWLYHNRRAMNRCWAGFDLPWWAIRVRRSPLQS
jgi:hypothetical protein